MIDEYEVLSEERKRLQAEGRIPEWMATAGWQMFKEKYLYEAADPKEQFMRIAKTAAKHAPKIYSPRDNLPEYWLTTEAYWAEKFFHVLWKGWLACSTPVLANMGTTRGCPVSCAGSVIEDSIKGFYDGYREIALLTKEGFGTASDLSDIRPRGSPISVGGKASGVVPVIAHFVQDMRDVAQGCYIEGTQVLTSSGFVDFRDISENTQLAQLDSKGGVSFTKGEPTVREWNGSIYNFHSTVGMNLSVTPNHRMMINRRKQKTTNGVKTKFWSDFEEIKAEDVKYHRDVQHHVAGNGGNMSELTAKERFLIAYQADGVKYDVRHLSDSFTLRFNFKKERKIERMKSLLNECGLIFSISKLEDEVYSFHVKVDKSYYNPCFDWVSLIDFNGAKGMAFLREVAEWDGSWEDSDTFVYSNTVLSDVEKVQAVAAVSGVRTKLSILKNREGNRKDLYRLYVSLKYKPVQGDSIETCVKPYNGKVYCCVVPNGRIIVKDNNGFVSVCGNTARRGAWAAYLNIEHGDFHEVVQYLEHNPDDLNIGWIISDGFIDKLNKRDKEATKRYQAAMKVKMIFGKGYFFFIDKANRQRPEMYKDKGLKVASSQLCSEIMLHSDLDNTFTCVLSWMNLAKADEWAGTDAVFVSTVFLDCVVSEFIERAKSIEGLENAVLSTEKGRAIGLGAGGLHTYLQEHKMEFGGMPAHIFNNSIFQHIDKESLRASKWLAEQLGEPEWCKGHGLRFTHRMAVAPTKSTALIYGGISEGINPDIAMSFTQSTAAGEMDRVNPTLLALIKSKGLDVEKCIADTVHSQGSVQHVDWLDDEEKRVFKTAFEINQRDIIRLASVRQRHIDQGQSVNLFFSADAKEEDISAIHQEAFENENILSLYYVYSSRGVVSSSSECVACM